jgi:hypothetical protein
MRITIGLAGLLALGCGAAQAQDCHLKQYASFSFKQTPQALMLPVRIDDVPKDLAFDLSNSSNALDSDTVHELNLHQTTIPSRSHVHRGGAEIHFVAHATQVTVDGATFKDLDFLMLPAAPAGSDRPQGEIGTRLFENADIELDMAGGKLNLFSSDHCPGQAVYWTTTGFAKVPLDIDEHDYIRVEMQLDGKPVKLALNTDGHSSIGMNAMRQIFGLDASSPGMTLAFTSPEGVKYYQYAFQKLEAGGLTIGHPAILVRDEPDRTGCVTGQHLAPNLGVVSGALKYNRVEGTKCYGVADGDLGLSVLSKLHLYVSKKEKLLYLTGAEAH